MPTYEYECLKCHKEFEFSQSMKDKALTTCPKTLCRQKTTWGKGRVKRKLGVGAGFIFKGSGFYITDYRSEGYKKDKSESAKASEPVKATESSTAGLPKNDSVKNEVAKKNSGKSDSKPAAKPAAKTG